MDKQKDKIKILRMLKNDVVLPDFAETYQKALQKFSSAEIGHAINRAQLAAQQRWEMLAEQNKCYRSYKKGVAVKLGFGTVGLGLAATGLALALPSGGSSLVLAVVASWRSLVDLAKTLYKLTKEAEQVGEETRKMLRSLKDKYEGKTKGKVGTHIEKLNKSMSQANNLTLKVNQILESGEIPKLYQRAEQGLKSQQAAAEVLEELKNKSPNWTQKFDNYFAILVNLGLAAAGDTKGFLEAKEVLDWVLTGVTTTNDLAATIKDVCEAVEG